MFRSLWIATLASNIGTWLQSVGAAWLMTSLSPSAAMVALVQAATSLPMFLLSLPAGALADVVDRRRILLVTQSWMLLAAAGLSAATFAGWITPWSLLLFTALLGFGAALNQPAWQSIIPEVVPREDLPAAISLGSVGFNLARAGAWLSLLSSLNVAIQTLVPSWVRGRALSVYMLFIFGSLAGGSALWGAVADRTGIARALLFSAAGLVVGLAATFRIHLRSGEGLNLAPSRQWPAPRADYSDMEPDQGPILVLLRYRIDPERAAEFAAVLDDLRRVRLRAGALQWGLFSDAADPSLYTEMFLMASWMEHMRHRERVTVADEEVRRRAGAFHLGPSPQEVEHLVGVTGIGER